MQLLELFFIDFPPLVIYFFLLIKYLLQSKDSQKFFSYSSEMMGDPALAAHLDLEEMGPLISQDFLEQLQNKYVQGVRVRLPSVADGKKSEQNIGGMQGCVAEISL